LFGMREFEMRELEKRELEEKWGIFPIWQSKEREERERQNEWAPRHFYFSPVVRRKARGPTFYFKLSIISLLSYLLYSFFNQLLGGLFVLLQITNISLFSFSYTKQHI
jgi:hypothetical protein